MNTILQRLKPYVSILILIALVSTMFWWPMYSRLLGALVLVAGLGMAITATLQQHLRSYRQAQQTTRLSLVRNTAVDVLGLLIPLFAASYLGGQAGMWAEALRQAQGRAGPWAGLAAGMIVRLAAAWSVRRLWRHGRQGWRKLAERWAQLKNPAC